jgi:hypothetical protein
VQYPEVGAHPLSSIFNEQPILIVEGEDEQRIWQQAVRSSQGRINVFPVECGGTGELSKFEQEAEKIIASVYDSARGFSLRDGDGIGESLGDFPNLIRLRLSCYSSENLMLSNEVLESVGLTWEEFKQNVMDWINKHK